jgi:hypothetical protein
VYEVRSPAGPEFVYNPKQPLEGKTNLDPMFRSGIIFRSDANDPIRIFIDGWDAIAARIAYSANETASTYEAWLKALDRTQLLTL